MAALARSAQAPAPITPTTLRGLRAEDVIGVLGAHGVLIVAMWVPHGGLDQLGTVEGVATAAGQLMALIGTYLSLIQLVLMSRAPWLDRVFGRDRLTLGHRW